MSYQFASMSQAQIEEFLQAPRFAIVGTNRAKGPPQLTPVWYLYEDNRIYVTMFVDSVKYRNLHRDPKIGVCIAGENPDARAVMIYGSVDFLDEDTARANQIRWRLVRRYYDSDEETQSFLESEGMRGEKALAIVTPHKIVAEDFNDKPSAA